MGLQQEEIPKAVVPKKENQGKKEITEDKKVGPCGHCRVDIFWLSTSYRVHTKTGLPYHSERQRNCVAAAGIPLSETVLGV
ncbi:MAG: hypothetical protein HY432_00115 [Candidatus Liptonbacteria bacterium]|nr:hypothetical protein [Candidatus Liptonbacteria bacterium]